MKTLLRFLVLSVLLGSAVLLAATNSVADGELQPALASTLSKRVASFEKKVSAKKECRIYVLSSPEVLKSLVKSVGKKIGKCKIKTVEGGDVIPPYAPDVLIVGAKAQAVAAINYARSLKILTVALNADMVCNGAPVGLAEGKDGRPHILLNLKASSDFELNWNASIMKYAETLKTFDKAK